MKGSPKNPKDRAQSLKQRGSPFSSSMQSFIYLLLSLYALTLGHFLQNTKALTNSDRLDILKRVGSASY